MERRKFEESWKEAFDQAEISPSENVWTNIALDLEKAKARKLKRRLVFYQLLAAASVIFAIGIGLGVYVNNSSEPGNTLASQQNTSGASNDDQTATRENLASNDQSDKDQQNLSDNDQRNTGTQRSREDRGASPQHDEQNESDAANNHVAENDLNGRDRQQSSIAAKTETTRPSGEPAKRAAQQGNRGQRQASTADIQTSQTGLAQAGTKEADGSDLAEQNTAAERSRELIADNTASRSDRQNNDRQKNNTAADQVSAKGENNDKTALSPANGVAALPAEPSAKQAASEDQEEGVFGPAFERKLPPLVMERKPALVVAKKEPEADPVALMLARLERREQEVREQAEKQEKQSEKDKHGGSEKLWTSVGFAAGSFNPLVTKTSTPAYTAAGTFASDNANKEMQARGATYSVGVNMGTRLSERWVLQGGVNYLTQASDYTQTGLVPSRDNTLKVPFNFGNEFTSTEADSRQAGVDTPPYNVNNSVRYLSVPMQAGYMIINKDFGLQLNAGVSTDLLLQNTITATATVDGQAVDSDLEGSAYREVNLSGLMGTEVSYRFGRRYRIALNPGMRYPFTNIYKTDDFRATRLSFDIGLRFRYIFN